MLLIPEININGDLSLDAYSYSRNEINTVTFVLERAKINFRNETLERDNRDRIGLRFILRGIGIIKIEKTLNLKFIGKGKNTEVNFGENFLNFDGSGPESYRCSRIDTPPHSCETIYADDDKEAIVKCALIANSNNWLGGVPSPGQC